MVRKAVIILSLFFVLVLMVPAGIIMAEGKPANSVNTPSKPIFEQSTMQSTGLLPIYFPITNKSLPPAEMILIPAGEFKMGCDPNHNAGYAFYDWQLPLYKVWLDAYLIDKLDVTNARYAECLNAGTCSTPFLYSSQTRPSYYNNPAYAEYPVIYISWG